MDKTSHDHKPTLRAIIGWFLYDWACSAFSIIITTFVFATYFTQAVAKNKILGTTQWGNAIALASFLIAVLSPIFGAIADHQGRRKPWLAFFSLLCIFAAALIWFVKPDPHYVPLGLLCIILGSIGLEIAVVFYNSMLRDLAPKEYTGRYSGWAWGLGYFGGIVSLTIALVAFIQGHFHGLALDTNQAQQIRICGPLVAVWYIAFGWPLFVFTPDRPSTGVGMFTAISRGCRTLIQTFLSIKKYHDIVKFLLARLFYIDALNTIFAFGGIYAAGVFHMGYGEVIEFGIALNIGAGIGAVIFAWLDDYKGSKITILITLFLMLITGIGMVLTHSKIIFWLLGMGLSLCVGPIQAASRSLLIRLSPPELITEMFGLFALSGKICAFIGPWVLAWATSFFNSQRIGMSTVFIFLAIGALLLMRVSENNSAKV